MRRQDPLIIGGGPAGSAVAIALARMGAKPLILERQAQMGDALCGGFMSWRTIERLKQLAIAPEALGGHPIRHVRVFARQRMITARLPAPAIGVSRHRLDTLMLGVARTAGAGIAIEDVRDWKALNAESVFLATGKRDLRGLNRPRTAEDPALGLRLRLPAHQKLSALIGDAIELHVFEGGYAGLLLQEDGSANLCMAVRKSNFAATKGDAATLLETLAASNPAFAERLSAVAALPAGDAVGAVPYGWRARETPVGLFRVGDQAAVIPSLAGEGMGIALASGLAAAAAWSAGGAAAAPAYQAAFAQRTKRPVAMASTLWRCAEKPYFADIAMRLLSLAPSLMPRFASLTRIGD
jgi:menaquinone-9 beta-reductase